MARDLAAKRATAPKGEFEFLQKAYGLTYCPQAILYDEYTRTVVGFPDSVYWLWMHCLLASGGVGQYHVNQFIMVLVRGGIQLSEIDTLCSKIAVPSGRAKLTKSFFVDRVVHHACSHIRAFASEVITCIQLLGIFVDVVVRPTGMLADHINCFDKLRELVGLLASGDSACSSVALMRGISTEHHVSFLLYTECLKPKLHYLKHAIDCIEKFQCNLSRFGPERKHKDATQVAAYSYNKVL